MSNAPIDFLRPRRVPALGWLLFAAGSIALVAAAWLHQRWNAQRAEQEASLLARQTAQEHALEAARRPRVPSIDERRLQRMAPQLEQPWLPALRAIEGATESPVFLLAMTIDPSSGRIQLDGEAPSFDHALAYIQRLSDDGALAGVHLTSHEAAMDASGRATVRLTVLAQWARR
jgi:hypothetical protein